MIINLRKMMYNGKVYKIFLWGFLLMFIGGGIGISQMGKKPSAIQVYDHGISREVYFRALKDAEKQQEYYKSQGVTFAGKNVRKDVLKKLVKESLEKHLMEQLHLQADDFYLQKTLHDQLRYLPDYFFDAKGKLDEQMFKRYVSSDTETLLNEFEFMAKQEVLHGILDISQYTAQFELNAQYNREYGDKTVEVVSISPSNYTSDAKKEKVSDEKLAAFYKKMKNKDRFKTKEKRAGQSWTFDQGSYNISVSDKEIKKEYDKRKKSSYLLTPAEVQVRQIFLKSTTEDSSDVKERLQTLRTELVENPKTFADVAKKVSEDKDTASKGGLIPFFAKDSKDHDALLVKKAFETLNKDGQISQVLKVKDGYVLLQRVSRKNTEYKALKSVKDDLLKELSKDKFEKRFMQAAKRMISQVKYKPELLQSFVDKHHGDQKFMTLSARESSLQFSKLFQTDKFKYNVYFDEKGNGVILYCSQVDPSVAKPLADVRKDVEDIYYRAQGKDAMNADIAKIMEAAKNSSLEDISKDYSVKYERAKSIYKNGKREDDNALSMYGIQQKLGMLQYPGDVVEVEMAHGNAILKLVTLGERNQELFEEKKKDMKQTLFYAEKYKKRDSFVASLGRNAIINNEIEIKDEFKPKVD
jgi:parvulin-like peptidyl-prolyl isomerase